MDKIEKIHIARVPYSIEAKAEIVLGKYLIDIRSNLDVDTSDEVIHDIESRIPELLSARHVKPNGVITHDDVLSIKEQLGEPEQFSSDSKPSKPGLNPKKLFRDMDSAILGGVASGIGKYFNIDANLVRIAFFVAIFLSGFGILLYAFLWLLLPEAKTGADKLLMSGEPVTAVALQRYRESVQKSLGKGPKMIQKLIIKILQLLSVIFTGLIALILLSAFGIFSGLFYMYPFRPIVSSYNLDYVLLGLMWLGCFAFIGLLVMLSMRIWGYKSSRLNISALALGVLLIITAAGITTSSLLVYNHFSNKYGDNKNIRSLNLTNQTSSVNPSALNVNSDSNLDLTYVVTNQPIHATYEDYPGMNRPNISISINKGIINIGSPQLDQAVPSCLGNLCKKIYLPVHVFLYGPALKLFTNNSGATLTINNSNLGPSVDFKASGYSTININNSYATNMSITASYGASISANNTISQNSDITVDSASNVTSPTTTNLSVSLPTTCYQDDSQPVLFIPNSPQKTLINGQLQTANDLDQNNCIGTEF